MIQVVDYDPAWPETFEELRQRAWRALHDVAEAIEHVGSTSVPRLAAKPVIDMSVVVSSRDLVPPAIERLARIGYVHRGNLGIVDREAFRSPADLPAHNLYLCPRDGLGLRNHRAVRDYLRANPERAREYGALKKRLAVLFPEDIERYVEGKSEFIQAILRESGMRDEELDSIRASNVADPNR